MTAWWEMFMHNRKPASAIHIYLHIPGPGDAWNFMPSSRVLAARHHCCRGFAARTHRIEIAAGHNLDHPAHHSLAGQDSLLLIAGQGTGSDRALADQGENPLRAAGHMACSHLAVDQGIRGYPAALVGTALAGREMDTGHIQRLHVGLGRAAAGHREPADVRNRRKDLTVHRLCDPVDQSYHTRCHCAQKTSVRRLLDGFDRIQTQNGLESRER